MADGDTTDTGETFASDRFIFMNMRSFQDDYILKLRKRRAEVHNEDEDAKKAADPDYEPQYVPVPEEPEYAEYLKDDLTDDVRGDGPRKWFNFSDKEFMEPLGLDDEDNVPMCAEDVASLVEAYRGIISGMVALEVVEDIERRGYLISLKVGNISTIGELMDALEIDREWTDANFDRGVWKMGTSVTLKDSTSFIDALNALPVVFAGCKDTAATPNRSIFGILLAANRMVNVRDPLGGATYDPSETPEDEDPPWEPERIQKFLYGSKPSPGDISISLGKFTYDRETSYTCDYDDNQISSDNESYKFDDEEYDPEDPERPTSYRNLGEEILRPVTEGALAKNDALAGSLSAHSLAEDLWDAGERVRINQERDPETGELDPDTGFDVDCLTSDAVKDVISALQADLSKVKGVHDDLWLCGSNTSRTDRVRLSRECTMNKMNDYEYIHVNSSGEEDEHITRTEILSERPVEDWYPWYDSATAEDHSSYVSESTFDGGWDRGEWKYTRVKNNTVKNRDYWDTSGEMHFFVAIPAGSYLCSLDQALADKCHPGYSRGYDGSSIPKVVVEDPVFSITGATVVVAGTVTYSYSHSDSERTIVSKDIVINPDTGETRTHYKAVYKNVSTHTMTEKVGFRKCLDLTFKGYYLHDSSSISDYDVIDESKFTQNMEFNYGGSLFAVFAAGIADLVSPPNGLEKTAKSLLYAQAHASDGHTINSSANYSLDVQLYPRSYDIDFEYNWDDR